MRTFKPLLILSVLLTFGALSTSCGDDEKKNEDVSGDTTDTTDAGDTGDTGDTADMGDTVTGIAVSHTTYNVGLARGFVDNALARQPAVAAALGSYDADVVCLQEVWDDDAIADIQTAIAANYPHTYVERTDNSDAPIGPPPCGMMELTPLLTCATMAGCDTDPERIQCVLDNCSAEFQNINGECTSCVAANAAQPTLQDVNDACIVEAPRGWVYDGHNGLMLLSKHPFDETDHLKLDSCLTRRVILYASIDTPAGTEHAFCTHLSARLETTENTCDQYPDWATENLAQVNSLIQMVNDKAGTEPAVIMGDFNTGPDGTGSVAEIVESFDAMIAAGWAAPYTDGDGTCTYCPAENDLVESMSAANLLDHIFIANVDSAITDAAVSERRFDEKVMIDVMGTMMESSISDHYGVEVTLTYPEP